MCVVKLYNSGALLNFRLTEYSKSIVRYQSFVTRKVSSYMVMSRSVPTAYIHPPPQSVQHPGKYFDRSNPGHPSNFFCLIPRPWAKAEGGGAKLSQTNTSKLILKLTKIDRKLKKLPDRTLFIPCITFLLIMVIFSRLETKLSVHM